MAVSILSEPPLFTLVGGGLTQYTFLANNRVRLGGVKASNGVTFTRTPQPGDTMVLHWGSTRLTFTFGTDTDDPFTLPMAPVTTGYAETLAELIGSLQAVRDAFTVEVADLVGQPYLLFKAREEGTDFSFVTQVGVGGHFATTMLEGKAQQLRPRYSVWIGLCLGNAADLATPDGELPRIYETSIETDEDGFAHFDVAALLESALSAGFPTGPNPDRSGHVGFYVEYAEAFGEPLQVGRVARSGLRHGYLGGGTFAAKAEGFRLKEWVQTTLVASGDRALRHGPTTRYVNPAEPQWLTFLNTRDEVAGVKLQVNLRYAAAQQVTRTDLVGAMPFPVGEKLIVPVGAAQLGIAAPMGRTPLTEYSVQLVDSNGTPRSLAYRFVIDYQPRRFSRALAYINSLGCIDAIMALGKGSGQWELVQQQAERMLVTPYTLTDAEQVVYDVTLQDSVSVTTGFLDEADGARWRDFYRARQKWHVQGEKSWAIGLNSNQIKVGGDEDNLRFHQFGFVYLHRDRYAPDLEEYAAYDPTPPPGFQPTGTIKLSAAPTVVNVVDQTIPAVVRELTLDDVMGFKEARAWGNPNTKGFLTHQLAAEQFATAEKVAEVATAADATKYALLEQLVGLQPIVVLAIPAPDPS